jgi:predicted dehydrogenase
MLRIGLIGVGYWGPNYARVVSELRDAELVAACDISEEAVEFIRARYPRVRTTRDPADLLADEDIDAIIVATPTSTHYPIALAGLEAK